MKDRLKKIMDEQGMNARQFAEEIGVQASSISHILTGRNKPSIELIQKLAERYPEVDLRYLISGVKQNENEKQNEDLNEMEKQNENLNKNDVAVSSERIVVLYKDGTYKDYFPR